MCILIESPDFIQRLLLNTLSCNCLRMEFIQVTRIDYTGDKVLVKTPKDEYLADKVNTITIYSHIIYRVTKFCSYFDISLPTVRFKSVILITLQCATPCSPKHHK